MDEHLFQYTSSITIRGITNCIHVLLNHSCLILLHAMPYTRNTYRIQGFSVEAVNVARKIAGKEHSVDRVESPQWHYICCGGTSAAVAHTTKDASEQRVKKQDSSHPKTFAVKCFGPIAYPLGGSRYHTPTETKTPAREHCSGATMTTNPLVRTGLDSIGHRVYTNTAGEGKTGGDDRNV